MKISLSSAKHIPIITQWDNEYYPWQLHHLIAKSLKFQLHLQRANMLGMKFTPLRAVVIRDAWGMWNRCYKPTQKAAPDYLILDAWSGEGETLLFYYLLGIRRFRLVGTDQSTSTILKKNTARLGGLHCELSNRAFQTDDLQEVDFAKIDVEGER